MGNKPVSTEESFIEKCMENMFTKETGNFMLKGLDTVSSLYYLKTKYNEIS
jgi:hypothetical protein